MQCVRKTEILIEQQFPHGVFVCDHAGLEIKKFLLLVPLGTKRRSRPEKNRATHDLDEIHVQSCLAYRKAFPPGTLQ